MSLINIKKRYHARKNHTRLKFPLFCLKCKAENNRKVRASYYIDSLYRHYLASHSGMDRNEQPTRDYCTNKLQEYSDQVLDEIESK